MAENRNEKTVGIILKETRVAKKISLEEVSKHTKIHINMLKLIEADEFKNLGVVYSKSFLKLYAEYLNLDKEALFRRFESEQKLDEFSSGKKLKIPEEQQISGIAQFPADFLKRIGGVLKKINLKYVLIIVICLLFVAGVKKLLTGRKSLKLAAVVEVGAVKVQDKKSPVDAPQKQLVNTPKKAGEKIVLVVRAKQKCWLQVKVDGKIVFQSILSGGAAESWQAKEKIELWLGNAGGVELELNGKLLEKIGRPGQTLKNVVVTRDGLSIRN